MPKHRFKLVAGNYAVGGNLATDNQGKRVTTSDSAPFKLYRKGDIVESEKDLAAICNKPGSIKFQRLDANNDPQLMTMDQLLEQQKAIQAAIDARQSSSPEGESENSAPEDGLEDFTVAELRQLAEESEVDVTGLSKKSDLIDAIRMAGATI